MREEKRYRTRDLLKAKGCHCSDILELPQVGLGSKAVKTDVRRENMSAPSSFATVSSQGKMPESKLHEHPT